MANSCGGADASVPAEIEVVLKDYIKKRPQAYPNRKFFDQTDDDGQQHSCLLEDLGGKRCPPGECCYNQNGKPTKDHKSKKPIPSQ